jgi:TonB family protein
MGSDQVPESQRTDWKDRALKTTLTGALSFTIVSLLAAGCASAPTGGPEEGGCVGERVMGHAPNLSTTQLFQARMRSQDLGVGGVQPELYPLEDGDVTVTNPTALLRYLDREYRPNMRSRGFDGVAQILTLVGKDGSPAQQEIMESTGWKDLDDIAERVAARAQFTELTRQGTPVCYWVVLPLSFTTR